MGKNAKSKKPGALDYAALAGLFLLTFSLLALEVAFTRLYSFLFTHGYVYVTVSLGIAGIGLGALLLHKIEKRLSRSSAIVLVFSPWVIVLLLLLLSGVFSSILFYLVASFLLFLDLGLTAALVYKRSGLRPSFLYAADLGGAALGSLFGYFLIQNFGAPRALQAASLCVALAVWLTAVAYSGFRTREALISLAAVLALSASLFVDVSRFVRLPPDSEKEMAMMLKSAEVEESAESTWTAFGRTDLVDTANSNEKALFIDGSAGTIMLRYDSGMTQKEKLKTVIDANTPLALATASLGADATKKALVIGSGGGIDVVTLLAQGVEDITAVEINPDFIETVRRHSAYNGGIYASHPNVRIINGEGRHFVRNTNEKYDLLVISLPLIKSIRNYASYAMSENYLFTSDAFGEYRRRLADGGYFFIVSHSGVEALKLVMNAHESFLKEGVNTVDAMRRIAGLELGHQPVLVVKNKPFTQEESDNLHGILHLLPWHSKESVSFIPNIDQALVGGERTSPREVEPAYMFNVFLFRLAQGGIGTAELQKNVAYNIAAISDDSPFFYFFEKGIPGEILAVFLIPAGLLFWIFITRSRKRRHSSLAFILSGAGFLMMEVVYLQKYGFFWGQSTLSLAVLLAVILLSAGLGSLVSRLIPNSRFKLVFAAAAVPLIALLFLLAGGPVLKSLEGAPGIAKLLVTLLFALPQFLTIGFVFPTLLEGMPAESKPAMIGLNSLAAVAGGALAVIIAMLLGFSFVLILGGLMYLSLIALRPAG